jgi:glucosamine--fructose-6-phosphate aminotransferase (isomerizing)
VTALAETIAAQPELLAPMLSLGLDDAVARLEPCRRIWLVGTGTSQHAAELGARMLGSGPREPRWASSATFSADAVRALRSGDGVIVISHTTETALAGRARALALAAGAALVTITGQGRDWPEAVQTTPGERSETYTASYLAALIVLARLALALEQAAFVEAQLSELPDRIRAAAQAPPPIAEPPARLVVLAGADAAAVTAREGALKLREAARVPAEGYESEYLLHGSAVALGPDDAFLAVAPRDDRFGITRRLVAAAAGEGLSTYALEEPPGMHPLLAQLPLTVRLQRLASHFADLRGQDPDHVILGRWADDDLWGAGAP